MWNYLYLGACLLFALLVFLLVQFKQRINTVENKLFKIVIVLSIISITSELILQYLTLKYGVENFLMILFSKIYLVSIIAWFIIFSLYIFYIFRPDKDEKNFEKNNSVFLKRYKKIKIVHFFILLCATLAEIMLPIKYYKDENIMYSYGGAVDFLRLILLIFMTIWIVISIKNHKKILKFKYSPIFIIIILLLLNIYIQSINQSVLILSFTFSFLCYIMYFTIENPDMKMVKQLNIAKEQAEKANNAKSEFLSSMSHEIRTPLNAIVGFSESLKEEELSDEAREEVDDIIEASQALLETVNGILDISKIEANKIEIINGNYEFKKLFNELVALSKARLGESKPIDFRYHMSEDIPDVLYGDSTRIRQVVLNFLTNAIKYTNEGYINFDVSCIKKDNICRLIIKVEDTGIGIKQESINRLFDKFDRLDNENSTIEGTGLGLAITKKLISLMNGKIVVQSVYGKGSQFMVILNQKIIEETKTVKEEMVQVERKVISDYSSKKILIVDDNALNLKVAVRLLKQYNLQVEEVDSGFKCLDLVKTNKYDLILMDDMMPKMSGKETFIKLKEIENFNTPVVILTANAISGMKEEYLSQGFNDYLAKPIERGELDRIIKKFLDK